MSTMFFFPKILTDRLTFTRYKRVENTQNLLDGCLPDRRPDAAVMLAVFLTFFCFRGCRSIFCPAHLFIIGQK